MHIVEVVMIGACIASIVLHVYIFIMEMFLWTSDSVRKTFATTRQFANTTKEMAANQGVYNLLLAIVGASGLAIYLFGWGGIGEALVLASCGSMFLAATFLFLSTSKKQAALKQGIFPLITVLSLLLIMFFRVA